MQIKVAQNTGKTREARRTAAKGKHLVALFVQWDAYGGPEEGGWWYTRRTIEHETEHSAPAIATPGRNAAKRQVKAMNKKFGRKPRRSYEGETIFALRGTAETLLDSCLGFQEYC